ncbi:2-C-methyl-D-erythritol 4-phosphate cytidylyltransferase [Gudongella oleilytica]|jgi:2-C-methyl-D-erythritol 4-phosphate cytidylyltransferase|uniref:2-C-methyl-D-erythritol 4-phosphate cytidylyltransferase n=1 Tax=Gudongella oleilytica TaxID=1582259 RepID=UPI0019D2F5C8|nr:2-C-methyl-D-erythritol 4-phosphate cytidylyltransferase [Gudongella oleilytica]HMM70204.1 2-C-methyl-D-erythritol 4-phosphate cytidylyltransferase [Gudongella oleilytica]
MYKGNYVSVIIAAAGMSNRMGSKINKQFIVIDNKPILAHTIEKFEQCRYIDEIIVVTKENEVDYCRKEIVRRYGFKKVSNIIKGGKERQDSVYNGIMALNEKADIVLTHDGARPFVRQESILKGIKGAYELGACVIGVPLKDTIKVVDDSDIVHHTPKRSLLWAAQTPQCFKTKLLKEGYEYAFSEGILGTDDSSLVEKKGYPVTMLMGSYDNIKITTPEDLVVAELIAAGKYTGAINSESL